MAKQKLWQTLFALQSAIPHSLLEFRLFGRRALLSSTALTQAEGPGCNSLALAAPNAL